MPPSENESGVLFNVDITCVRVPQVHCVGVCAGVDGVEEPVVGKDTTLRIGAAGS